MDIDYYHKIFKKILVDEEYMTVPKALGKIVEIEKNSIYKFKYKQHVIPDYSLLKLSNNRMQYPPSFVEKYDYFKKEDINKKSYIKTPKIGHIVVVFYHKQREDYFARGPITTKEAYMDVYVKKDNRKNKINVRSLYFCHKK